jgi:RHS repeat-associated protein
LAAWQNAPTSPTTTAQYLSDGEGQRVVQQVTDSTAGTTTTTSYVGRRETVTRSGSTTTTTDYASAGSVLAESVNGTLSYLATNYEGSVVEALDGAGVVTASQLYTPYGSVRYQSGALPTDYGYTGQRSDATTGLDYYGARYYDPLLGQFTSADTLLAGGLNRYGYVGGNPTTATDPSGQMTVAQMLTAGGGGDSTGYLAFGLAAIAAVGAGVGIGALTHRGGTTTSSDGDAANAAVTAAIAASTYTVAGGSVYVTATGALVVTTGASVTAYTVGSAGWLYWQQQISVTTTTTTEGAWNTGRARNWVATHPETTKTGAGPVTETGTGGGGGLPGNVPSGSGVRIPATPPIGITVGIGIGIASSDAGGPLSLNWWRGLLYAKKADLKQLRAAARQAGITDEEDFREFGDWLEQDEKHGEGRGGKDHYSFKELVRLAKEWLELYK